MEADRIRATILEVIKEKHEANPDRGLQEESTIREVARRLDIQVGRTATETEQQVLTVWHDLFRTGILAWGHNLVGNNRTHPFFHLTHRGQRTLETLSRDPANPDGYMQYLQQYASLNAVAESYIREALETYNNACFKATAVMVGCAGESLVLQLRDDLKGRLQNCGAQVPNGLDDFRVKQIIDSIAGVLDRHQRDMPDDLRARYDTYWAAFGGQIRLPRNEAGHPKNVDPVSPEDAHASLLTFPSQANLIETLRQWISTYNGFQ